MVDIIFAEVRVVDTFNSLPCIPFVPTQGVKSVGAGYKNRKSKNFET
jgi:hypothetical protein